jgi:hypothetical protein
MRVDGPSQPARLLLDVIDRLVQIGVPYAVVGAFAVACYGIPRYTGDADGIAWLKDSDVTAEQLKNHLAAPGYVVTIRRGDLEDPITLSIRVDDEFENRLDLLLDVRGMDPDAVSRCVTTQMMDSTVRVIAAEDLVGMKLFAGGPQDVMDVRGILQVWRERLDPALLKKVALRYGPEVLDTLNGLLKELPLTDPPA